MFEEFLDVQNKLIKEIYTVDQNNVDSIFVIFLDRLGELIEKLGSSGYSVDVTDELLIIQRCYEKRDLTELSDYLLYEFKPSILELQSMIKL